MTTNGTTNNGTSGLSKTERHVLQANGDQPGCDGHDHHEQWGYKIRKKVQPTISDVRLLLEHKDEFPKLRDDILACQDDLKAIRRIIDELLG